MILSEKNGGILISVRVLPNSSKNNLDIHENTVKIKLKSPPIEGKANKELIKYFSKILKIKKNDITIKSGERSKNKTLFLNMSKKDFLSKLEEIND